MPVDTKTLIRRALTVLSLSTAAVLSSRADYPVEFDVSLTGNAGSGTFAPYYLMSNNNGRITSPGNALIDAGLYKKHRVTSRFSYTWGIEVIGGYSTGVDYTRYDAGTETWSNNRQHPPRAWIQQLYGRVDYRSLFLSAGLSDSRSALLNDKLSSGDLTEGSNTRGIPQVRVGFNDFQPIPFTNGWVEIQGEISYGKMLDNEWTKSHANLYNSHVNLGALYSYKRCYFRTKSSQPLTLTLGMQVAAIFGGTTTYYRNGEIYMVTVNPKGVKEFFKMLIPTSGDEGYYLGNTLGSWDILFTYRIPGNRGTVKGYLQKPWETGSGIGFLNGCDGLWGLEYAAPSHGYIDGIVAEYFDFTNQSGPIHFDPSDLGDSRFPDHTDGRDNYYNNDFYNSYVYHGMSLGTPILRSVIYNTDGFMRLTDNRIRGFHIGVSGTLSSRLGYRVLGGYRRSWGTPDIPRTHVADDTSLMVEGVYKHTCRRGNLTVSAAIAMDRGKLLGNTFGALVSVKYNTSFNIGCKR